VPGVTPDYQPPPPGASGETLAEVDVEEALEEYSPPAPPEVVFVGCPHARAVDVARLARLVERLGGPRPGVRIVATLSRAEYSRLSPGDLEAASRAGIELVRDTCLIVSPFGRGGEKPVVATNSYKAYFYLSARRVPVGLAPLEGLAALASRRG